MTKQLIPKRRFKGFEGEWEVIAVKGLGEKFLSGGTPKTSICKYWSGDIPWLQSSDLLEDKLKVLKINKKISREGLENSAAQLIPANSIAIVTRVGVGKVAYLPYAYTTSQDFLSISHLKVDGLYAVYLLYKILQKQKKLVQGTSIKGLTKDELLSMQIKVTGSLKEQQKIGEFFKVLDARIANQERKIKKIKAIKQAYLTEMFPQEGEDVPRRRFNNFDSIWQVSELQDLVTFSKGRGYSKKDIQSEGTPLLLYGTLYTNYESIITDLNTFTNLKENSVLSLGEEVVIPSSGETSKDIARASAILARGIIIGGDLNVLRPNNFIYSSYLALNLSNSPTKNQLARKAQGSSVVHLYNEDLKSIKVCYPTLEEQQKIGEFFKMLDEKIEAEEKKLEKLKKMKEAFLEEMFV